MTSIINDTQTKVTAKKPSGKKATTKKVVNKPATPQASSPVVIEPTEISKVSSPPKTLSGARAATRASTRGRRVRLGNVRKIATAPMSPRSVHTKFASSTRVSKKDLRDAAANISRSVSRISHIATALGKAGSNGEVVNAMGETTTREDLNNLISATNMAIRLMPRAAQRSTKRTPPELTSDERSSRIEALVVKMTKGLRTLCASLKNKNAETILTNFKIAKIRSLVKPPKADSGDQISSPFYISDQLRLFFSDANLGNGLALFYPGVCSNATCAISGSNSFDAAVAAVKADLVAAGITTDPVAELGGVDAAVKLADPRNIIRALVIERGIATSPLLMSLMALYILANGLKCSDSRIRIDDHMKKHFGGTTNTRSYIAENDMTAAAEKEASIADPEGRDAIRANLEKAGDTSKSGLQRLTDRPSKKGQNPFDGSSITRSMSITLAFYYRVKWVPKAMAEDLNREGVRNLAYGVKAALVKSK